MITAVVIFNGIVPFRVTRRSSFLYTLPRIKARKSPTLTPLLHEIVKQGRKGRAGCSRLVLVQQVMRHDTGADGAHHRVALG